jgi:hypothetical protein
MAEEAVAAMEEEAAAATAAGLVEAAVGAEAVTPVVGA